MKIRILEILISKLEFGKLIFVIMSLVAVPIFNNFTHEICGDINKYGVMQLYNEKFTMWKI